MNKRLCRIDDTFVPRPVDYPPRDDARSLLSLPLPLPPYPHYVTCFAHLNNPFPPTCSSCVHDEQGKLYRYPAKGALPSTCVLFEDGSVDW